MTESIFVRRRVPIGFACAVVAYWLASPSIASILWGLAVATPGELIRLWAAGHLDKGREITASGPYRFVRHPLYLGSAILGAGFIVAAASWTSSAVVAVYLGVTLTAAIRAEESALDGRFGGAYSAYRTGRTPPVTRAFSLARVRANREHRAVFGFVLAFLLLYARMLM